MSKNRVATYGSLRKGEGNYEAFSREFDIEYVGTYELDGFKLYSFGGYPGVNFSDNPDDKLTVDLLLVDDACKKSFDRMEIRAGYRIEQVIIDGEPADIYIYNSDLSKSGWAPLVEHGDWSKYLNERNRQYA